VKILVSGATGLIGQNLVKLLSYEHKIIKFTRNSNIDLLPCDIDIIFHLAQSNNFRDFPQKTDDIFNINTLLTLQLLEFGRKIGIKKFFYASSGGIYGNDKRTFSENDSIITNQKLGFYLSSKLCSEILLDNYEEFFDVFTLRFFFVFGENQKHDMLIPRLIKNINSEKNIIINGDNGICINPIYVNDAVDTIINIMNNISGSHKINIAGDETISLKDLAIKIGKLIDKNPLFIHTEADVVNILANIDYIKNGLYNKKTSLEKGLKNTIAGVLNGKI